MEVLSLIVFCAVGRCCGKLSTSNVEVRVQWHADNYVDEGGCGAFMIGARIADVMNLCSWDTFMSAGHIMLSKKG